MQPSLLARVDVPLYGQANTASSDEIASETSVGCPASQKA